MFYLWRKSHVLKRLAFGDTKAWVQLLFFDSPAVLSGYITVSLELLILPFLKSELSALPYSSTERMTIQDARQYMHLTYEVHKQ